ncbi:MAG: hypothetical protein Q9182_006669, partial [Xanthomendoza sp. 2 TL-2023]
YNGPGRIHTAKPYPLTAPNGSTVLFLGHESGLRILWRGGRSPKDPSPDDDVNPNQSLLLDTDDKVDDSTSFGQNGYLESDEEEHDPSLPFEPVIQCLDLPFGVAVLQVAFPHIPMDPLQRQSAAYPPLYSERLVAIVVCSDASVRLVTLPLAPPRLRRRKAPANGEPYIADERVGPYGDQVTTVTGGNDHQLVPKYISLTLVLSSARGESDLDMDEDDVQLKRNGSAGHRRQGSQRRSQSPSFRNDEGWDILVASSSSNLLLVHRIPLTPDGASLDLMTAADHTVPWTIQHLPSPAASIQFNPSLPPDESNAMLLVAEAKGPVRIFNCMPTKSFSECTWLVSLLPGFHSSEGRRGARKGVLDAQWVQGGKAILVLLADGDWGVWDLRDPKTNPSSRTQSPQAARLGSFSTFVISGSVNAGSSLSTVGAREPKVRGGGHAGKLAPTTPGTRRVRQDKLFSGPVQQVEGRPARGGISVVSSEDVKADDESVLLWHNDNISFIPSLRTHWKNKVKGSGNLFGGGAKGEARRIDNISLRGEQWNDVSLFPPVRHFNDRNPPDDHNVLVLGESRFVVVAAPLGKSNMLRSNPMKPPLDQKMLQRGDLTLEGMDRVLARMTDGTPTSSVIANGGPSRRKVSFLDV